MISSKGAASLLALSFALAASGASAQTRIEAPWSVNGALAASDGRTSEGQLYDDHPVQLQAGQRLRISVAADGTDTMLSVLRSGGAEALAQDDDSGGALNPRLNFIVPADGEYIVRVLGFSQEATGPYRLSIEPQAPLPQPVTAHSDTVTTTGTWRIFSGALSREDPDVEGRHFDDYQVDVPAGGHVLIQLDSQAFDPLVQVFAAGSDTDYPFASDDDGGPGLNSLLLLDPPEGGNYVVRVTSFGPGGQGAYRLSVTP